MCGIAGTYDLKRDEALFEKALKLLHHRGPDNSGLFRDEKVILGHTRLSILDLSAGANQPFHSSDGNFVLVFNGEIYNFKQLREKHKLTARTNSDTEVIAELFAKKGIDCLSELNGIFALAIYDRRSSELIICRDSIGIKPLYYFSRDSSFCFASELKSIKQLHPDLSLNRRAVSAFLHLGYIPAPYSIYNEVKKLEPGSYVIIKNSEIKEEHSYYALKEKISADTVNDLSTAKKELGRLIENAVSSQLISDVPLGVFLSGGIDSSLVSAIAAKHSEKKLNTFSIAFDEKEKNEAQYAKKVAKHIGSDHHEFVFNHSQAAEKIHLLNSLFDEPFADSSALPMLLLSAETRKKVTVALAGDGGDELFMGYGSHYWASRLNSPAIRTLKPLLEFALKFGNSRQKRAAGLFSRNDFMASHIFSQEQYLFSENDLGKLLKDQTDISNLIDKNIFSGMRRVLSAPEQQSLFDLMYYLPDDLLVKVDRSSMYHSLEVRVPLLDKYVVEYSLNLSQDLKLKKKDSKYILKQVLYDHVPASLFQRPKQGFSIPLNKWLKKELAFLIDENLNKEQISHTGILNFKYVNELVTLFRENKNYEFLYNRIWTCVVLQQWLRSDS